MDQIEKFVKDSGLTISAFNVCFYDSNGTDEILDNILCGKKRANTGLFSLFEAQMQLLPRAGQRYAAALHYPHHKGGRCPV